MTTPALPFDPSGIHLDRRQGLSHQLYQVLRARILDGRLSAGTRLPASRDLAQVLVLSRNTVMRAYDQLYAEGFIEGKVGSGTFVARFGRRPEKQSTHLSTGFNPQLSTGLSTKRPEKPEDTYSSRPFSEALERLKQHHLAPVSAGAPCAFRVGMPAVDLFPFQVWARLQAGFWRKPEAALLGYAEAAGYAPLRELIAAYLRGSRGMTCSAEQIVITSGAQQGISLCAQLLSGPGQAVAVENPGYRAAAMAFANAGAQLHGIALDDQGMDCRALADVEDCRLAYVTPAHQYPTGVTMSLARRLELLGWAERVDGWIVEDDYDGEYRYQGAPLAPLAALDRHGRVVYVGTFGKVAFPALRLGYLVVPPALSELFALRRAVDGRHVEIGTQGVMARFIAEGHFQRHIRRMRRAALSRRDALLDAWPQAIPGCAPIPAIDAGLHVKIDVADHAREQHLIATARKAGVELNGLTDYWLRDSRLPVGKTAGLVLGFAAVKEPMIREAVQRLRKAWDV